MNNGAGFLSLFLYAGKIIALSILGEPNNLDRHHIRQTLTEHFVTRLKQAKKHLISQIQDLINQERLNKIGLITFNH